MINKKIEYLSKEIKKGMFEREEVIDLSFLALLSGESIFMLGLPGVAKSMIARRMKSTLKDGTHFEYLMNRFSSPEEIFGPISLKKLDEDKYERVVEGYMPTANIAFLDEIWKASPSIQNTLLTIVNEKLFRNGSEDIQVPLKLLIAASNELPASGEGLEALYDRFLIRYYVPPIQSEDNFNNLIQNNIETLDIDSKQQLSLEEIEQTRSEASKITVSESILSFVHQFRKRIAVELKEKSPYISDRRWKKIFSLLRMNAYISGRESVGLADLPILKHAIWETEDQQNALNNLFNDMWYDFISRESGASINEIMANYNKADTLNKTGFIYSKKQYSVTALSAQNKQQYEYLGFTIKGNNSNKYFIPTYKGNPVSDYSSYTYVYNSNNWVKSFNNVSSNSWYTSRFDWSNLVYDGHQLIPHMVEDKQVDVEKLTKAKDLLDSNTLLIYGLQEKTNATIDVLLKEKSIFNTYYNDMVKKAHATIKDKTQEYISKNNSLIAEVVSNIKNAQSR